MDTCEGCGGSLVKYSTVRLDSGEVIPLCGLCVKRVRRLDGAARSDLSFCRGPLLETRMRFFPTGYSADLTTLAIDHKGARYNR